MAKQDSLLRRVSNGWPLFWSLALPLCLMMTWETSQGSLRDPEFVSHMISYSVRWSVPFIYLVLAASSLRILIDHPVSLWLMRNRKHLGLVFAVAMAWQGAFILLVSSVHAPYYYSDIYYLRDELEGSCGYLFLVAMVLTSFRAGRRRVSASQWRLIHKTGVYFLWAYPYSVYWWNCYYYDAPRGLDYVFFWTGFAAFALRIAAWTKLQITERRRQSPGRDNAAPTVRGTAWPGQTRGLWSLAGYFLLALGLAIAASGRSWQEPVSTFLLTPTWSATLELWLPYWPLEPFLPLFVLGLAGVCLSQNVAQKSGSGQPAAGVT